MSLVTEVQTILDDNGVFWPLAHIYDAANEILATVWPKLQTFEISAEMVASQNADLVDLPQSIMIPKYIVGISGTCFTTSHARLEQYWSSWRTAASGKPKHFVLWDYNHLRPWPKPDANYVFDVYGVPWPTEISATVTDVDCDSLLRSALAHRVAAKLMLNTQPLFAQEALTDSERLLHDYQVRQRNSQSHHIMRLRPGTLFTSAQSGSIPIGKRLS